jgi:DNA (cytosine-5)-methyltransferase 1
MWKHMARIIGEVLPQFVFVENSPMLVGRGLAVVLGDLAGVGYDARWGVVGAHAVGAPHKRERVWILGFKRGDRATDEWGNPSREEIGDRSHSNPNRDGLEEKPHEGSICKQAIERGVRGRLSKMGGAAIWSHARPLGARPMGVGNGLASDLDRIKAIGNGQVPAVVELAWKTLTQQ